MNLLSSPEPFTNSIASVGEDALVVAGLWTALNHPLVFLGALMIFLLALVWILPKIWRGIRTVASKVASFFRGGPPARDDLGA